MRTRRRAGKPRGGSGAVLRLSGMGRGWVRQQVRRAESSAARTRRRRRQSRWRAVLRQASRLVTKQLRSTARDNLGTTSRAERVRPWWRLRGVRVRRVVLPRAFVSVVQVVVDRMGRPAERCRWESSERGGQRSCGWREGERLRASRVRPSGGTGRNERRLGCKSVRRRRRGSRWVGHKWCTRGWQ